MKTQGIATPMNHPTASAEVADAAMVKRHYWMRDDFDHLMGLLPAKDAECGRSAGASLSYPKTTKGACRELRLRGLEASPPVLDYFIKEGTVVPERTGRKYRWHRNHIDLLAEELNTHEIWTVHTCFCWTANLRFGQCVKAFRVATARYGLDFCLNFNPDGLVVVIEPGANPNDYAYIRFFPRGARLEMTDAAREAP